MTPRTAATPSPDAAGLDPTADAAAPAAVPTPRRAPELESAPGWLVWVALGIVYVVWGSTYLAIAYVVETLPPLVTAGARFLLAGAVLLAVVVARRGTGVLRSVSRPQLVTMVLVGLLLLLGGNGLVQVAEAHDVPSGLAALLIAVVPLAVAGMRAATGDRPSSLTVVGVLVGFVGLVVLLLPGARPTGVPLLPTFAVVLAALSWSVGSFVATRRPVPADPFVATALQMLAGGVGLLIAGALAGEPGRLDLAAASTSSWVALAYLVVFGSLVAFTAYAWLLRVAPVSQVATYAYVNPVVAVLLGSLLLDEAVTVLTLVGGGTIVAAVALVVTAEGRVRRRAKALGAAS